VNESVESPYLARFESFEANLRSGELCKNGERIKLPDQSFQILAMLLEGAGEVVLRHEIQNRLWPNDTVVEFDNSINAAIKRLRVALGDSADKPRYIETLARRGYRWKLPVEWIESRELQTPTAIAQVDSSASHLITIAEPLAGSDFSPTASAAASVSSSPRRVEAHENASRKQHWPFTVGAAVVVTAAIAAGAYFLTDRAPKVTSKDPIIIADFINTTGDPIFDGTLRRGLASQLEQSPYLDILSDEQLAAKLRLMGQPAGARLTHELARQLCQRSGGGAVLDPWISQVGSQYDLVLDAVSCSTGGRLASTQAVASDKNHVLGALGSVASSIRRQLGESLASIRKFDTPLEDVTTPSLEALQAYTLGWQADLNGDQSGTVGSFQRAISLDSNFAMAYAALASAYFNLNEPGLVSENLKKALELQDRVSEREKFYISSHYELEVSGNLEEAAQADELWARTYPRDVVPVTDLVVNYLLRGQYERTLVPARRALELAPDSAVMHANLLVSYLSLGRLDDAAITLQQAKAHGIESVLIHAAAYELAFLEGDATGMTRETAGAAGKPRIEDLFFDYESNTAAYAGHLVQANDLTARAVASARQVGEKETAALYLAEAAVREALVGNAAEARRLTTATLRASNGRHAEAMAALALALAGNLEQAQKLANDLAKRFPQDTVAQFNYLPTIRAAIALRQNSPAEAIADLQAASPCELGTPALVIFLNLYPVYVRGQAYLAARQGTAAAAEFQKILDHPGIAFNEVISPLAHLGLAHAYTLEGDHARAKAAYQDFLTLWKDADPVPILKQAKAEYGKLR
jgi:DNA-binding winged helix-turn-helix (wHTH) protein/Tfp pilus assembly protein PilF